MKRIALLPALFAATLLFALSPDARADVVTGAGCGPFSASTIDPTCVGTITISTSGFATSGVGVTITNITGENPSDPSFIKNDLAPNALALTALFSASSVTGTGTFSVESIALAPDLNPVYVLEGDISSFALGANSITMILEPTFNSFWDAGDGIFVNINLNGTSGNPAIGAAVVTYTGDPLITGVTANIDVSSTPEPASLVLLVTGFAALPLLRRRFARLHETPSILS